VRAAFFCLIIAVALSLVWWGNGEQGNLDIGDRDHLFVDGEVATRELSLSNGERDKKLIWCGMIFLICRELVGDTRDHKRSYHRAALFCDGPGCLDRFRGGIS
jgi:hypothetical protein